MAGERRRERDGASEPKSTINFSSLQQFVRNTCAVSPTGTILPPSIAYRSHRNFTIGSVHGAGPRSAVLSPPVGRRHSFRIDARRSPTGSPRRNFTRNLLSGLHLPGPRNFRALGAAGTRPLSVSTHPHRCTIKSTHFGTHSASSSAQLAPARTKASAARAPGRGSAAPPCSARTEWRAGAGARGGNTATAPPPAPPATHHTCADDLVYMWESNESRCTVEKNIH